MNNFGLGKFQDKKLVQENFRELPLQQIEELSSQLRRELKMQEHAKELLQCAAETKADEINLLLRKQ